MTSGTPNFALMIEWLCKESKNDFTNESKDIVDKCFQEASTTPNEFKIRYFMDFVIDYWKYLKDFYNTYNALEVLCQIMESTREDTAKDRQDLVDLIRKNSLEWVEEEQ